MTKPRWQNLDKRMDLRVGGAGGPAGKRAAPRPGQTCWLCGYAIIDPPHIIGQWHATRSRVAHRYCLRVLGELDLDLPPSAA